MENFKELIILAIIWAVGYFLNRASAAAKHKAAGKASSSSNGAESIESNTSEWSAEEHYIQDDEWDVSAHEDRNVPVASYGDDWSRKHGNPSQHDNRRETAASVTSTKSAGNTSASVQRFSSRANTGQRHKKDAIHSALSVLRGSSPAQMVILKEVLDKPLALRREKPMSGTR